MVIKINNLVSLVNKFEKFADGINMLKTNILNAAKQGIIFDFIGELIKDNVNVNVKIGYTVGLKSLVYSEIEVSPLRFERGIPQDELLRLQKKYANVPKELKAYLTKYKMVPEGGPFIITFP